MTDTVSIVGGSPGSVNPAPAPLPIDLSAAIVATNEAASAAVAAAEATEADRLQTGEDRVAAGNSAGEALTQAGLADAARTAAETARDTAQKWATQTDAEVVTGQGYGAKKYAADAAMVKGQIDASIASLNASGVVQSPFLLDGFPPAAIASFPKGLFALNGVIVPISSLLSFSSAAKFTHGPDGSYVLNAANSPAYSWLNGRRQLLIEPAAATNYWQKSEDIASGCSLTNCTIVVTANALYGQLALATITQTNPNTATSVYSAALNGLVNGDVATVTVALLAVGSKTSAKPAIYGSTSGWGVNADTVGEILSGPGALVQAVGGLWNVTGLSPTVPTLVRLTRTFRTNESAPAAVYLQSSLSGAAGDQIKMGRPQLERGYGSSYIICPGVTPTTRAADIVTAASGLLALLAASNATLAMRGGLADKTDCGNLLGVASGTGNASIAAALSGKYVSLYDATNTHMLSTAAVASVQTFGLATSYTSGTRKLALNGGAVASDLYSQFDANVTGIKLGNGTSGARNLYIDEIVVWPLFGSDAGVQSQARVYS